MDPFGVHRHSSRYPYGYSEYDVGLENERRAMMQRRRQEERVRAQKEREMYMAEQKRRQAARREHNREIARQRAIQELSNRSFVRNIKKIQKWWRDIAMRRRAETENAAAHVITNAFRRFKAFVEARKIVQSILKIKQLRVRMNDVAPVDVSPPTAHKERLYYEDALEKIVLKVDLVESFGSTFVRSMRKQLILDANSRLRLLDVAVASEVEAEEAEHNAPESVASDGEASRTSSMDVEVEKYTAVPHAAEDFEQADLKSTMDVESDTFLQESVNTEAISVPSQNTGVAGPAHVDEQERISDEVADDLESVYEDAENNESIEEDSQNNMEVDSDFVSEPRNGNDDNDTSVPVNILPRKAALSHSYESRMDVDC